MRTMNEISMEEYKLEMDFSRLCRQTEEADRQAILRFRSWFKGLMDPEEEKAYSDAVAQCARKLQAGRHGS